jgi:hypothetical protein
VTEKRSVQIQQFEELSQKIIREMRSGSFYKKSAKDRRADIQEIKRILNNAAGPSFDFRKTLAIAAMLLASGCSFDGNWYGIKDWGFQAGVEDPFGMDVFGWYASYRHNINFADIDADGDMDMYMSQFKTGYIPYNYPVGVLNDGSAATGVFTPAGSDFSILNATSAFDDRAVVVELVDIDSDGDLDAIATTDNNSFRFWENLSGFPIDDTSTTLDPFGLPSASAYKDISFVDMDKDGDLDLFAVAGTSVFYIENSGTATSPAFAATIANPFDIDLAGSNADGIELADIDFDGDQDMFLLSGQKVLFLENIGNKGPASFAAAVENPSQLGSPTWQYTLTFDLVDIDNDGDLDIFLLDKYVGYYPGTPDDRMFYFENTTY